MKPEWGFAFDIDTKAISDEGEFSGYAAIFGNEDLGRDIIVKGAFAKSLTRRPAAKVRCCGSTIPKSRSASGSI